MPRLNDLNVDLEKQKLPTGNYSFSATRIDSLGATEYTLATIIIDWSGSTAGFRDEMEKCLKSVVQACKYSPRSDNLMIRLVLFAKDIKEIHGFKLLANCNESDYDGILNQDHGIGGTTALYDGCVNGIEASSIYGANLIKQDYSANAIVVAITDGCNNEGVFTAKTVRDKLNESVTSETLESMVSILVGVNITDQHVTSVLQKFVVDAGFTQYVDAGNADAKTLAKLAAFVSKSISSQSQALGSGGASKPLTF
jgi:hypothetical protein